MGEETYDLSSGPVARKFSISSKTITGQTTVTDATVMFFVDNFSAGMALEQKSDSWKDLSEKERKRYRNVFSSVKRAVRMVLMHADSYPPLSSDKNQFKLSLQKVATTAEERIRNDFDFGDKVITVYKLAAHKKTKELERILHLPSNTPEEVHKMLGITH